MSKKKHKTLTAKKLEKLKVPKVLIAGLILASVLGWTGWKGFEKVENYYQFKQIFPDKTKSVRILDGDTFTIQNGLTVRLLGIDAPNRGKQKYSSAKDYLNFLISKRTVYLKYDKYQDDKFGRILAYVWINCFNKINQFCQNKKALVNKIMVEKGLAKVVIYSKRKKLKYQDDLLTAQDEAKLRNLGIWKK